MKAVDEHFPVVLFITRCSNFLSLWMKSSSLAIQMKAKFINWKDHSDKALRVAGS